MELEFPKGFYWGAATSSHQVEGNNHNDWSEWEKSETRIKDLKRRGLIEKYGLENYISGQACDHYNRFREDFDIAKSLGHNVHRFSIEWSRVEPEEGKFDEKEIEHYRQVISALKERGIEPFVTLWHWTMPVWFAQKGGWLNKSSPQYFERYVEKTIRSCDDLNIKYWITVNEPVIFTSHSYLRGIWPPQQKSFLNSFKVIRQLVKAHKLAYKILHMIDGNCQVGIAKNDIYYKSNFLTHYFDDSYFTSMVREFQDFSAINYYRSSSAFKKRYLTVSDTGWRIHAEGIYHILKRAARYKKPIFVTENGLADATDKKRTEFIIEHLYWVAQAIREGVDVRGYFHWSLMDNFEWDKGFWPRFGLVEIDYKTLERKIRPSAWEYKRIIENRLF